MVPYIPHPDLSYQQAEPVNDLYITPGDAEYCLNCAMGIRLSPVIEGLYGYWFHIHTKEKNCLGGELLENF